MSQLVRLYTVYTDTMLHDYDSNQDIDQVKYIQGERDNIVLNKMRTLSVPSFPMATNEFVKHMGKFKVLTTDPEMPNLCMLFHMGEDGRVIRVREGQGTTFASLEAAAASCAPIDEDKQITFQFKKVPGL